MLSLLDATHRPLSGPLSPRTTTIRPSPGRCPSGQEERYHRLTNRRSQRRTLRRVDFPPQGFPSTSIPLCRSLVSHRSHVSTPATAAVATSCTAPTTSITASSAKLALIIPASDFGLDDMTESMDLLILIRGIDGRRLGVVVMIGKRMNSCL